MSWDARADSLVFLTECLFLYLGHIYGVNLLADFPRYSYLECVEILIYLCLESTHYRPNAMIHQD